jgi:pyrroline-5-carboxylate reductase
MFSARNTVRLLKSAAEAGGLRVSTCVVALKPQILQMEASNLRRFARPGTLMLSIAAGTSIAALRKAWGRESVIVRAMPNTPGAIGHGISVLYAPLRTPARYRTRSAELLAGLGETLWVGRETLIDAVTAVSGSGPAYVFLLAESLASAAREEGLSAAVADRLARATVAGAGALLASDPRELALLRGDVTSPGGTTEAALKELTENDALKRLMRRAVAAARGRAAELRRQSEA